MRAFLCWSSLLLVVMMPALSTSPSAQSAKSSASSPLENAFEKGWILQDTNGDDVADFLNGHVIVPAEPTAAENAAAANLAARLGYQTTGLTMPVVKVATQAAQAQRDRMIFVGAGALPSSASSDLAPLVSLLGTGEGGVFLTDDNLAVIGNDAPGLLAAATAFAARSPYQWATPGEKIETIAKGVNEALVAAKLDAAARLEAIS